MRTISILLVTSFVTLSIPRLPAKTSHAVRKPAELTDAKPILLATPAPGYPYAAREGWLEGEGLFLLRFDPANGVAREVSVIRSTGHAVLDQAAVSALRQWKIKPHTYEKIKVPINFELTGEKAATMRAMRGKVLFAPPPHYPLEAAAHGVAGRGRFLLLINPSTGLVTGVQIIETTHDRRLDDAAVKAFLQWRFRPHTLSKLIVPLDFGITYG